MALMASILYSSGYNDWRSKLQIELTSQLYCLHKCYWLHWNYDKDFAWIWQANYRANLNGQADKGNQLKHNLQRLHQLLDEYLFYWQIPPTKFILFHIPFYKAHPPFAIIMDENVCRQQRGAWKWMRIKFSFVCVTHST